MSARIVCRSSLMLMFDDATCLGFSIIFSEVNTHPSPMHKAKQKRNTKYPNWLSRNIFENFILIGERKSPVYCEWMINDDRCKPVNSQVSCKLNITQQIVSQSAVTNDEYEWPCRLLFQIAIHTNLAMGSLLIEMKTSSWLYEIRDEYIIIVYWIKSNLSVTKKLQRVIVQRDAFEAWPFDLCFSSDRYWGQTSQTWQNKTADW